MKVVACLAIASCLQPTEIVLVLSTDVPCATLTSNQTVIAVGAPGSRLWNSIVPLTRTALPVDRLPLSRIALLANGTLIVAPGPKLPEELMGVR